MNSHSKAITSGLIWADSSEKDSLAKSDSHSHLVPAA